MRPQYHQRHAIKGATIVPAHEIEPYIALGWRLTDEPSCGAARIVLPLPVARDDFPNPSHSGVVR